MGRFSHQITKTGIGRTASELLIALIVGCAIGVAVIVSTRFVENWKLLVGLVGGPAFVFLTLRWPEYSLLALIGMTSGVINTNWLPLLRLGPASVHLQEIMLALLIVLLIFRSATWDDFRLRNSPLSIPVLLFIIAIFIAIFHAFFVLDVSLKTMIQRGRNLLLWTLFFPIFQLVRDRAMLNRFLIGIWVIAGLLGLGVVIRIIYPDLHQFVFPVEIEQLRTAGTQFGVGRVFQYRGGALLYAMLPVTVATLAFAHDRQLTFWRTMGLLLILALISHWLFRSFQRSMWVSASVVLLLLFLMLSNSDRIRLVERLFPLLVLMFFGGIIYWQIFPRQTEKLAEASIGRIATLTKLSDLTRTDDSVDWRVIETRYALETFRESPLFGIGPGNEYRPPLEREILWNEYGLRWYIHNAYLSIAVLTGLAGLLPFLLLSVLFLLRILAFWKTIDDPFLRAMYLGFGLSFLGQMISNNTQPTFFDGPAQSFYPAMLGLCECILAVTRQERMTAA